MLRDANELHAAARPGDLNLRARQTSFDIARGMMRVAPEVLRPRPRNRRDARPLRHDREQTTTSFALAVPHRPPPDRARRARRRADRHRLEQQLGRPRQHAGASTQGPARRPGARRALIQDLKRSGLLEETLIAICTEFGRTPWTDAPGTQGSQPLRRGLFCLLAGAGVKRGTATAQTDEHGINIVAEPGPHPRLSRDDSAPDGHRSRPPDLSLCRPRFPADRCAWACRSRCARLDETSVTCGLCDGPPVQISVLTPFAIW